MKTRHFSLTIDSNNLKEQKSITMLAPRILSIQDFKAILCMNFTSNNPVTINDIEIAQEIFGSNIRLLKCKTTKKKLIPVVSDYMSKGQTDLKYFLLEISQKLIDLSESTVKCMSSDTG
jgi:hypothetical protein